MDAPVGLRHHQHLGAWPEGIGPDREGRVVAELELAQLGAQPRQQHAQPERLGDVVIGAAVQPQDRVGVGIGRGQHDDRGLDSLPAHQPAEIAAVGVRQADIHQDHLEMVLLDQAERLLAIGRLMHGEALMQLQLLGQRPAQRIVVIDDQHLLDGRHHESFATPAAARPSLPLRPCHEPITPVKQTADGRAGRTSNPAADCRGKGPPSTDLTGRLQRQNRYQCLRSGRRPRNRCLKPPALLGRTAPQAASSSVMP